MSVNLAGLTRLVIVMEEMREALAMCSVATLAFVEPLLLDAGPGHEAQVMGAFPLLSA